ncbi:NAD(P)-binding protein [Calocera cornea HHB12733]|uniref:NAD(P)-binding protein n=1 Tax=Calocera cornea HHB12733 TaxID=1353952 RepID=A0A165E9S4_9BASI|nr:NAD(P)-binding protein [Calocera cornea HHB12733]
MSPIPPGSLIVVTGITGYIGSHVGLAALQAGYRVRGTVRDTKKAEELRAKYKELGLDAGEDKLDIVIVDDLLSQEQYKKAFVGAAGIAHVALPGHTPTWIDDTITSVLSVLKAAAKEPTVKRVVLTSSSVTCITPGDNGDHTLTDEDWNDDAVEKAKKLSATERGDPDNRLIMYCAAKTISEQEAWKWMADQKPGFEFVTVLPNANFGPFLCGEAHSTGGWVATFMKGDDTVARTNGNQWYIDVRDDARLHILGMSEPQLAGKRIWAAAGPFGWNDVLAPLRKAFPGAPVPEGQKEWVSSPMKVDSELGRTLLGGWISLEESVVDTAKSLGY